MRYFTDKEFKCRCCGELPSASSGQVPALENIHALVANVLDPAREKLGQPITVNSGYRCKEHNVKVGGVVGSQHLRGEAADITCADIRKEIESAIRFMEFQSRNVSCQLTNQPQHPSKVIIPSMISVQFSVSITLSPIF